MARVTLTSGTDPRLRRLELHFARRRFISVAAGLMTRGAIAAPWVEIRVG